VQLIKRKVAVLT